MLKIGQKAPGFELPDQDGKIHKLSDYFGKKVVLYFYPKDNTPGCSKEACDFRDANGEIMKRGAVILGISKDSEKSHKKFADKFNLNFPILANEDTSVCKTYGVLKEKSMFGKKYMGIVRTTFLISEEGNVEKIWNKVKVNGHSEEVLASL